MGVGQTKTLTPGTNNFTGTSGDDTFDAGLSTSSLQTLNSGDRLDGGAGADELFAVVNGSVTPASMKGIETVSLTAVTNNATVDLSNAAGVTSVTNQASTSAMTLAGISTSVGVTVRDTSAVGQTVNYTGVTGTSDAATITLQNISGAATLVVPGVETLTLVSAGSGSTANVLATLTTADTTTLNIGGTVGLNAGTLGTTVTKVDASANTASGAGITLTMANTGNALTVSGGAGNDSITLGSAGGNDLIAGGNGNDTITYTANLTTADSIDGGAGVADTLVGTAANLETISGTTPTTYTVKNIERIQASSQLTGSITVQNISEAANRLNLALTGADITDASTTVVGGAGSFTLSLGETALLNTAGQLANASTLEITDTGSATTDSLTIINSAVNQTTGLNINVFDSSAITISGYESVTINSGTTANGAEQVIGAITITGDVGGTSSETLILAGANPVSIAGGGSIDIINAAALTGQGTNGFAFQMAAAAGATTITGSSGNDLLRTSATLSSTVAAGTGDDSVVGGAGNDTLDGGGGNDTIDGGAGNDNIAGGLGNDTVTISADANLTLNDTIAGGDGTDTLRFTAAITDAAATLDRFSGFEVFELAAGAASTLTMSNFLTNTGFTRVDLADLGAGAGGVLNNLGASVTEARFIAGAEGDTFTLDRLADTSSNSINLSSRAALNAAGAGAVLAVTALDEETINISGSTAANDLTITTLTVQDLTTLNITGDADVIITTLTGAGSLATVNAANSTGVVTINASSSAVNITATGGSGVFTFTGGNGADSITGGASSETLSGGLGVDTINGGGGGDTIIGGGGNDVLTGGASTDDFYMTVSTGVDTITDFVSGTDDLDVSTAGNLLAAAINANVTQTAASAAISLATFFTDNNVHYYSFNGTAGNLTTGGTATLSESDLTSTDETALVAYLAAHTAGATSGANTNDVVLVVNFTGGAGTNSYVYEVINDNNNNALQAAEITLIAVVNRGSNVLAAGDVI